MYIFNCGILNSYPTSYNGFKMNFLLKFVEVMFFSSCLSMFMGAIDFLCTKLVILILLKDQTFVCLIMMTSVVFNFLKNYVIWAANLLCQFMHLYSWRLLFLCKFDRYPWVVSGRMSLMRPEEFREYLKKVVERKFAQAYDSSQQALSKLVICGMKRKNPKEG